MIFRPRLTLVVGAALVVLIALGVWQLQRRAWKHELTEHIAAQLAAEPRDLVEVLTGPPEAQTYAHVEADGTIDAAKAVHLFSPTGEGPAYRVIAPLDYGEGRFILVDLGTITEAKKRVLETPVPAAAAGRIHTEGILRPADEPGWSDAAPDLEENRWYTRDTAAMAAALGLPAVPPFILQSEQPNKGGLPKPVPFRPALPDNHLAYAVTWFSFALILVVIYGMMSRRPPAQPGRP